MKHVRRPELLLTLLGVLLFAGCAGAPRHPETDAGERIANSALAEVGRPYLYGGSTPAGFDCSGLVSYAHLAAGISVPRTTAEQHRAARAIGLRRITRGDLLFFRFDSQEISHVGIYVGDGNFVHAPKSGKTVEIRALDDPWYRSRLVNAARLY